MNVMKKSAFKTATAFLLSFVLIFSFLLSVNAGGYNAYTARQDFASKNQIPSISDYHSEDSPDGVLYGIYNAGDLVQFSDLVNDTTGKFRSNANIRVCLCNSIDMSGRSDFQPIGNGITTFKKTVSSTSFAGIFDGCGYVIDNLTPANCYSEKNNIAYVSLFGSVKSNAQIKNLVIGSGCVFTNNENYGNACVASLAARVEEGAEIKNVLNLASVSGGTFCGGLVARVDGSSNRSGGTATICNCTNNGSVNGSYSGGLVGSARGNLSIDNCTVRGIVTGTAAGGAIGIAAQNMVGTTSTDVSITLNSVTVTGSTIDHIVGSTDGVSTTQTKCTISGEKVAEIGVQFHGVQLAESKVDDTVSIRFIASLDCETQYSNAGFLISANGSKAKDLHCTKLFTSLLGQDDDKIIDYTAKSLRGDDGYLFAATIKNIPMTIDSQIPFAIQAYVTGQTTETYRLTLNRTEGGYTVTWNN